MMHAVIRNGTDALHLIGPVDTYTLDALRDYASSYGLGMGPRRLEIEVTPDDEQALARRVGGWLMRLARHGVTVEMRQHPPC
ncbi:MAG TPA: hypothetical protein VGR62_18635 [Candidatus Binatia bacterium]|jgi:hypothetical protein|nr:hypothetical protein [Candidatus Binatia bacterium]